MKKKILALALVLSLLATMFVVGCEPVETPDDTTAAPGGDSTTVAPDGDSTTAAPDGDSTTAAPDGDTTTAAPDDETTAAPEDTNPVILPTTVTDPNGNTRLNLTPLSAIYGERDGNIISYDFTRVADGWKEYTNTSSEYVNKTYADKADIEAGVTFPVKTTEGDKQYYSMIVCEFFDGAVNVDGFAVYAAGYKQYVLEDKVDILVSSDGETWSVAWSGTDLFASQSWVGCDYEAPYDGSGSNLHTAVLSGDFVAANNVKYVAYASASTRANNPHYFIRMIELEIYGTLAQ